MNSIDVSFVLGTGRCGSTLFHEILVGHPEIAFVSNLEDRLGPAGRLGSINKALYRRASSRTTRKSQLRFAPSEAYLALAREVSPTLVDPYRDLTAADLTPWMARRLQRFLLERPGTRDARHVSHKFTGWSRAGLLDAAFPGSRFVHVVRDGRAVANSLVQMSWWQGHRGPENWAFGPLSPADQHAWDETDRSLVALAGLAWALLVRSLEAARDRLGDERWLDLRYEDLVVHPDKVLSDTYRFLGLEPFDGQADWLSRWPMAAGAVERFRSDLSAAQVAEIEHVAGPELGRWGYT